VVSLLSSSLFPYSVKALSATGVLKIPVEGGEEAEVFKSLSSHDDMALVH
jgi:hypothetical protein